MRIHQIISSKLGMFYTVIALGILILGRIFAWDTSEYVLSFIFSSFIILTDEYILVILSEDTNLLLTENKDTDERAYKQYFKKISKKAILTFIKVFFHKIVLFSVPLFVLFSLSHIAVYVFAPLFCHQPPYPNFLNVIQICPFRVFILSICLILELLIALSWKDIYGDDVSEKYLEKFRFWKRIKFKPIFRKLGLTALLLPMILLYSFILYIIINFLFDAYIEHISLALTINEKMLVEIIFSGIYIIIAVCSGSLVSIIRSISYSSKQTLNYRDFYNRKNISLTIILAIFVIIYSGFIYFGFIKRYPITLNYYRNLIFTYEYEEDYDVVKRVPVSINLDRVETLAYSYVKLNDTTDKFQIISKTSERLKKDDKHVYLDDSYIINEADSSTFAVVNEYYVKDKNNIYYLESVGVYTVIPSTNAIEFKCDIEPEYSHKNDYSGQNEYCTDGLYLYYQGKKEDLLDLNTFVWLVDIVGIKQIVGDKNGIYIGKEKLSSNTPDKFKLLNVNQETHYISSCYFTDGDKVFYHEQFGKTGVVEGADKNSFYTDGVFGFDNQSMYNGLDNVGSNVGFEDLLGDYAKNAYKVFFRGEIISNADSATFITLNRYYAKDKNRVYFEGNIIESADPSSFAVYETDEYYAKDKNYVYHTGRIDYNKDPNTFVPEDIILY